MLFLHFYNTSYFEEKDYFFYGAVRSFMHGEIIIYLIDALYMILYTWVLFNSSQFHFNFNLVSGAQYVIHLVDNLVLIVMRVNWALGFQDETNPLSDFVSYWTMKISTCLFVAALCALPFSMIERYFASYFVRDYEVNQRRYISYILVFLMFVIGVIGGVVLNEKENTVYVMSTLSGMNVTAIVSMFPLCIWNTQKNKNSHENIQTRTNILDRYSLAKRLQLKENIQMFEVCSIPIIFKGSLNNILAACVYVSTLEMSPELQVLCTFSFEIIIFCYSFVHPQIMSLFFPKWREQACRFIAMIGCWRRRGVVTPSKPEQQQQRAVGMELKGPEGMERHFLQLHESWNKV